MNLFLIGYRGSGKSTIGLRLAEYLDWQWLDTDDLIVARCGRTISDIFERDGENVFRDLEFEAIKEVVIRSNVVVSLGGGSILNPLVPSLIAESGKCIWLRADPKTLHDRLGSGTNMQNDEQRPPLTNFDGLKEIEHVLSERILVYEACADYSIDTNQMKPDEVVDQIVQWLATVDNYS